MTQKKNIPVVRTVQELRLMLTRYQNQRIDTFSFLPGGPLERIYDKNALGSLVMDMMPLTNKVSSTVTSVNGKVSEIEFRMTYRPCARMLDAWRMGSVQKLSREEQQALRLADGIVREISGRTRNALERLCMLYAYVAARTEYCKGKEGARDFDALTSAATALINKRANCQGFAEMMFLMGSMMNFQMSIQSGESASGGHSWSIVDLGSHVYAMDCSAAAVARDAGSDQIDFSNFLMGKQEAAEQHLTWTPEQENIRLSPALASAHDYYLISPNAVAATSLREAARALWAKRLKGGMRQVLRLRAGKHITLQQINDAITDAADDPDILPGVRSVCGGRIHCSLRGHAEAKVTFCTVEWKA